jgi:hypothetical protein
MGGYIPPDAASIQLGKLPGNGLACVGTATLSIANMNEIPTTPRDSLLSRHSRQPSEPTLPPRTPRDEVHRHATATLSNAGVALTGQLPEKGYEIDEKRQAALNFRLAEKIRDCEEELAKLKQSPRKGNQQQETILKEKLIALKKGLHGTASVTLPPLKASRTKDARKSRNLFRLSLSPGGSFGQSDHVAAPQTARAETEQTRRRQRYEALMKAREPLVDKLRRIDAELNPLAEELNLPPPKPAASKPPLPRLIRAKSQDALPPTQL